MAKKLVRKAGQKSLKSQGAGYSTTNKKGETTFYKSAKDAPGYSDTNQSRSDSSKGGTPISRFDSAGNTITSASIAPATNIKLPTPPAVDGMYGVTDTANAGLAGTTGGTYDTKTKQIVPPPVDNSAQALFQSYLTANDQAFGEMQSAESRLAEQQKMLKPKEKAVSSLTAQLNTITTNRDAEMLKLEGAGRGVTESIIGGQQAQISREAAIQAMPVQAQLAVAQDDLDSARSYASQLFQAQSQDAQAKYAYKKELNASIYGFLNDQEKTRVAQNEKALDRQFSIEQANRSTLKQLSMQAIENGQSGLAAEIMRANPASETFDADFGDYASRLRKPMAAVSDKRQTQVVDGKLIDMQTGEVISDLSGNTGSNALGNAIASSKIDNINNILNSGAMGSVVGPSGLARTDPGLWGAAKRFFTGAITGGLTGAGVGAVFGGVGAVPGAAIGALTTGVVNATRGSLNQLTGESQAFIGSVEQMRAELTKEKLAQAKGQGVTFGALSDGERGLIANAATKIGTWAVTSDGKLDSRVVGYNVSEKDFKREMDVINYFTKLDAVLKGAKPADIGAVTNPDGTIWILNSDGTTRQIKRI